LHKIIPVKHFFMGAEKPERYPPPTIPKPSPRPQLLFAALIFLTMFALVQIFFQNDQQAPALSPKQDAKLQKKLKEIDEAEQYALLAAHDGLYTCLHSGRPVFYLKIGEVWKYGTTTKGELGRYTASFLLKNNVVYIVQYKGNLAECLKQEQIKLFNYPFLPENLARPRPDQLIRPPYNPIMR